MKSHIHSLKFCNSFVGFHTFIGSLIVFKVIAFSDLSDMGFLEDLFVGFELSTIISQKF